MGEAEARGSLPSGWGTIRARMERAEARLWSSYMALTPAFAVAAEAVPPGAVIANGTADPYVPITPDDLFWQLVGHWGHPDYPDHDPAPDYAEAVTLSSVWGSNNRTAHQPGGSGGGAAAAP
jgi:hypothetical protein